MTPAEVEALFKEALEARKDLIRLEARLLAIKSLPSSAGIVQNIHGGISDPTAQTALALADSEEELERTKIHCAQKVNEAKELIAGVRIGLGLVYGDLLEDYYIRGLTWETISRVYDLSKSTIIRKRDTAFDWIASVGIERAKKGEWSQKMHGEIDA